MHSGVIPFVLLAFLFLLLHLLKHLRDIFILRLDLSADPGPIAPYWATKLLLGVFLLAAHEVSTLTIDYLAETLWHS